MKRHTLTAPPDFKKNAVAKSSRTCGKSIPELNSFLVFTVSKTSFNKHLTNAGRGLE